EFWDGPIPWATVKDFKTSSLDSTLESITEEGVKNSATNIVPAGSIVVPTRMAVGKAAINTIDIAINQDLKALLPKGEIDTRFLLHFLLSMSDFLEGQAQGATVKGIKLDLLKSLPFPDLSLKEQRRIAEILDKADGIRRKREQALDLTDEFLRSAFLDKFGDPGKNVGKHKVCRIVDLVDPNRPITYGIVQPGPHIEDGVPYIRVVDMRNGKVASASVRRTNHKIANSYKRSRLKPFDLLLSIRGHVGRMAFVPDDLDGANLTQDTARLAFKSRYDAIYVRSVLETEALQFEMSKRTKGGTVKGINLGDVKELQVPLPSVQQRESWAQLFLKHQELIERVRRALEESTLAFLSLSQRAFNGEL
ncbi:MAG TPA: restriction endonuclease subunit S, partial [Rhizobium sp.]|nr:restriction endonuclease subunit S [Rhizobium sp.]